MADRPVILVLSASAGAGHMVAARALEHQLHVQAPNADIEVLDVLAISNAVFRRAYAGGYMGLVRYAPAAMGWLYDAMDRPGRWLYDRIRVFIQDLNKLPATRLLHQRRPDLILNTHYLPAEIVAQMRREGRLDCPQVIVTTDYETHRMWAQQPAERYFTATDDGKVYLATWGVPAERIRVAGIPVRAAFETPLDRAEARRRCNIDPDRPLVLLLSGGFGVGPTGELLAELISMPTDAQIAVITGRNERLHRRLQTQADRTSRTVRIIGFTDAVHEWMRAADLVVTKPGGLTVSEALASELPMVIMNPIPGQETRNSDYLLERGAAIKVNHPRLLGHRVGALLADPARLNELRAVARRIARPHAAHKIVEDALQLLNRTPV